MTDQAQSASKGNEHGVSRRTFMLAANAAAAAAVVGTSMPANAVQPTFDALLRDFSLPAFEADDSLVRIQEKGELVICTSNDWPYSFVDAKTGEFKGIEADILRLCTRILNIGSIRVETVPFDGMIPGLLDGRFDMVGDSIHFTPKRAKVIDFSFPTYFYADGMVVRKGNASGAKSLDEMPGKSCGALLGTNYAEEVQKHPVEFKGYKTWADMAQDIRNGRLDVALHDQPIVAASIKDHPEWELEMVEGYVPFQARNPAGYSVYGIRHGDLQLRAGIDAAIRWIQHTGQMTEILHNWGLGAGNT